LVFAAQAEQDVARGVNGICPAVASSPGPTIRTTWSRTRSTVMSSDCSTHAASPSSSRSSPSRMCSVPIVVLQCPPLLLGEDDHQASAFGEFLKQTPKNLTPFGLLTSQRGDQRRLPNRRSQ
jgi:hypothetical protein